MHKTSYFRILSYRNKLPLHNASFQCAKAWITNMDQGQREEDFLEANHKI